MKENSRMRMKMSIANELLTTCGSTSTTAASAASDISFHLLMPATSAPFRRQGRSA